MGQFGHEFCSNRKESPALEELKGELVSRT